MSTPNIPSFTEAVAESNPASMENLSEDLGESAASAPEVPIEIRSTFDGFSSEDVAKAREQEKAKLYPTIEKLKDEVSELRREREERQEQEARRKEEAALEERRKAEEEMDVRSLLQQKEQEFNQQLEIERTERERAIALLEAERQYQELQTYRQQRVEAERDSIIPELVDLIDGGTADEIEASIESLKDRSSRILDSAQQAMSSARRDMAGSRVTDPAAGPLDTHTDQRQFTPEDIRNMSVQDYQKYRERLLGNSASSRGRGLFG